MFSNEQIRCHVNSRLDGNTYTAFHFADELFITFLSRLLSNYATCFSPLVFRPIGTDTYE